MPRIRTIKPEFPQSESMGRISREARLCFIMMWTIADDEGRLRAASRMLASLLYPYDGDANRRIGGWLDELEHEGCIRRYVVDGATYAEITKWLEHQKIDRPSPSRLPRFDEGSRIIAKPREGSSTDLGPRTLDLGPTINVKPEGGFDAFWKAYPRKIAKGAARRAWEKLEKAGVDLAAVIAGAERYAASPARDPTFTKHPATWLNGECWLDEGETGPQPEPGIGKESPETAARLRATEAREREISRVMGANPGMLRRDAIKALGANGGGRSDADSPAKAVGSPLVRGLPNKGALS